MNYFDELCNEIFGYIPSGKGKSYELFVNCVVQYLNKDSSVTNDTFKKSSYSEEHFQLDGLLEDEFNNEKAFIEAKNYLDRNAKVGRGDIQKLSGALQVLSDIDNGIFASATDYTKPAIEYSKDLIKAGQKNIDLYIIRPVRDEDVEGRVMGLVLEIHAKIPHLEIKNIQWGEKGIEKLKHMGINKGEKYNYSLQYIYDANHNIIAELNNLYQDAQKKKIIGDNSWDFKDAYIEFKGELVPFEKILYNLTYTTAISKSEMHFKPVIYIKSTDGSIERMLDVEGLKQAYMKIKGVL